MTSMRVWNLAGLFSGLVFGALFVLGANSGHVLMAFWVLLITSFIWAISDAQRIDRWLAARRGVIVTESDELYKDRLTPQSRREVRQFMFFWAAGTWGVLLASYLITLFVRDGVLQEDTLLQIMTAGTFLLALAAYAFSMMLIHSVLFEGGYQKYVDEQRRRDREAQIKGGEK